MDDWKRIDSRPIPSNDDKGRYNNVISNDKLEVFSKFNDTLFSEFEQSLSGFNHIILKTHSYLGILHHNLSRKKKGLKKIKKAKNIIAYEEAVKFILK